MLRFIFIFLALFTLRLTANNLNVDSLRTVYSSTNYNDSISYRLCYNISLYSQTPEVKQRYALLAYQHADNRNNTNWMAAAKLLESYSFSLYGDFYKALECIHESQVLYKESNDLSGIATCYGEIGILHKKNKEYSQSESAYKKALELLTKAKDETRLAGFLINIGELYRENILYDKAILSFYRADSLYQKINDAYGIAYAKGNIGLVCVALNKLDSAKRFLNTSINILGPLGDNYAVSCYLDGLAEASFKEGNFKKAKQYATQSLKLAEEHGLKEQIRDVSHRLSDIYNQEGNYKQAYYYTTQYINYRDSINNEETIRKIANLHTKYQVAQKQKEIDEEKAKKEYYSAISISLVVIVGLFIILVFIMLKSSKERKKVNEQLEQQHRELEKSDVAKNKFFSILSHDLRGSVGVFSSFAEVIKMCVKTNQVHQLNSLSDDLERSSQNLLDLTDNLLHWGVKQMSAVEPKPSYVNVLAVIDKEVKYLSDISGNKGINLDVDIKEDIELYVDSESMSIAIRNLLSNALKFTDTDGTVSILAQRVNSHTIIKISDTGIGMSAAQKEKLFNFNEVTSTYGTHKEKGVGLGLQLVCDFVKEANANIEVETAEGEGTSFIISIPNAN